MKKILSALLLGATFGVASASTIQIQTGSYAGAGSFATADEYKNAVEAVVGAPTTIASYDNLTIGFNNWALESNITFGVSTAGSWSFRAGVDFGKGGAIYLDGVAIASKSTDMWWSGSYADSNQSFSFTQNLAVGNHTLSLYGMEGCCSGYQQTQFKAPGSNEFVSFSNNDGLIAAVPEPETYAMLLAGLGLMGGIARRRNNTSV